MQNDYFDQPRDNEFSKNDACNPGLYLIIDSHELRVNRLAVGFLPAGNPLLFLY